jgi:hypothetical protein
MITYDTREVEAPRDEVGSYRRFSVTDTDTGHELVYATNRAGEGLFHKLADGTFTQLAGTSQFELWTEAQALAFLRDKVRTVWGVEA